MGLTLFCSYLFRIYDIPISGSGYMSAPRFQLGHKKISEITFEWQAADKTALLALFMVLEIATHWLWCCWVWWHQKTFDNYVNLHLLYPLWVLMSVIGLFFLAVAWHLSRFSDDKNALYRWQIVLIVLFTIYISTVIIMMGYTSLLAGVSLVGGAMLAMMLIKRRYVWRIFLLQILLVLLVVLSPYFGVVLPNLRQLTLTYPILDGYGPLTYNEVMTIENATAAMSVRRETPAADAISELQRSSAFFWRSTHIYLAVPKAIFMVYIFRKLLQLLDDSKMQILKHANQDELTGLKNRRYGLSQMRKTLRDTKTAQDYSVLLMDLDLFKSINDKYGHEVGDKVLSEVSQVLLSARTRTEGIIISRYGGEEFLLVLPQTTHTQALIIAEQLRQDIAQHVIQAYDNIRFSITASFGLYTLTYSELSRLKQQHHALESPAASRTPLPNDICQSIISIADKALYEAKDRGRNQVVSANALLAEGIIHAPRYEN